MTMAMMESYASLIDGFTAIPEETKRSYRFDDETDGFLPFGSEYAHADTNPDLCERFCYWHAHATRRQFHSFSQDPWFKAAVAYEREISRLAQSVLEGICREFDASTFPTIRDASYLQLCVYGSGQPDSARRFAQAPRTYPALPGVQ